MNDKKGLGVPAIGIAVGLRLRSAKKPDLRLRPNAPTHNPSQR